MASEIPRPRPRQSMTLSDDSDDGMELDENMIAAIAAAGGDSWDSTSVPWPADGKKDDDDDEPVIIPNPSPSKPQPVQKNASFAKYIQQFPSVQHAVEACALATPDARVLFGEEDRKKWSTTHSTWDPTQDPAIAFALLVSYGQLGKRWKNGLDHNRIKMSKLPCPDPKSGQKDLLYTGAELVCKALIPVIQTLSRRNQKLQKRRSRISNASAAARREEIIRLTGIRLRKRGTQRIAKATVLAASAASAPIVTPPPPPPAVVIAPVNPMALMREARLKALLPRCGGRVGGSSSSASAAAAPISV